MLAFAHTAAAQQVSEDTRRIPTEARYQMTARYDESMLPLLADGKQQLTFRVKIIDTQEKLIKQLEFIVRGANTETTGTISVEKLRTEYLVTYTTPDITATDTEETVNNLIAYYRDDKDQRRYKEIPIPLENNSIVTVHKPGFREEKLPIHFTGPFVHVKVNTVTPDGEILPVRGAEIAGNIIPDALSTNENGIAEIVSPSEVLDNKVQEFSILLTLEDDLTNVQRKTLRSFQVAAGKEFGVSNVTIEDFLQNLSRHLAHAKSTDAGERLIAGLYRLHNVTYLINRGSNTAWFTARNIGKATRNQLWSTLDLHDNITLLTENIRDDLSAKTSDQNETQEYNHQELNRLLEAYPAHFVELASSVSGITIGLHTPELNEGIINGLFHKIIELVSTKDISGKAWGASWFEKDVVNYFREQNRDFVADIYSIVAEMINQQSFSKEFDTEALALQQERFQTNTDRILAEGRLEIEQLIEAEQLERHFLHTKAAGAGLAYNSLVTATEKTLAEISAAYIEDDSLAKWLSLYQIALDETKDAVNEAVGFAKKSATVTPFIIPLVFAEGPLYSHSHDPTMEKVSQYQLAITQSILYEQLRDIGRLLVQLNIDREIVQLTLNEVEKKLLDTQLRTGSLASTVPQEFRKYEGGFVSGTMQNIPLPRVITFALLVIIGMTYLIYTLLQTEKQQPPPMRPRAPENISGKAFSDTISVD